MPRTGYERTAPTGSGNLGLVFTIDKSGFYKGAKETGKALTDIQRKINSSIRNSGSKKTMTFEVLGNDLEKYSHVVVRTLRAAVDDVAKDWAKEMSAIGKGMFKEIIKSAPNRTKGPGRIESQEMLQSVQGRVYNTAQSTHVGIGWRMNGTGTYYRYFSFQEDGSRGGAMPMNAVSKTARYVSRHFDLRFKKELKLRVDAIK